MQTLWIAVSVAIAVAGAGPAGRAQSPPAEPTVVELEYRGLTAPDDPLSYRSFWGWGGFEGTKDPFVQAVQERVRESTVVYNGSLPTAKWGVIELKDKVPVALYFDTDADGKLSELERFPLTEPSGPGFGYPYAFVTSDFLLRTQDRREIPFRLLLVGNSYGPGEVSYMWSPCCVLEGQVNLAGEPMTLILYTDGFEGSFTRFGSCSFALLPASQKPSGSVSRSALSSLIRHKGVFYRVTLSGTHAKGETVRVAFQKDTTPTGQIAVELKGKEALKARLTYATITGVTEPSVHLGSSDGLSTLPVGRYRLTSGTISYGVQSDSDWQVTFTDGPGLAVETAQTSRIGLGTPALSIRAIKEQDRYASDAKEQSTFARGTPTFLTPQIKGAAGEMYVRFSQKQAGSSQPTDLQPHLTIVNSDGKQVVSTDMEYG